MLKNSFFKIISFLFLVALFVSCDKEFSVVGDDIISNPSFGITKEEYPVVAYNQKLGAIQSNDMPINSLGIYNNPSFGTTTANFVTQVALASLSTTFHTSAKIKSVVLNVPYFVDATKTKLDAITGNTTYELDSIYGTNFSKMKLSVYESGYFMRDLDPEDQLLQPQKYYTDQYANFFALKKGELLNDSPTVAENSSFFFDPSEVRVYDANGVVTSRSAPAMNLNLNKTFFQTKIIGAPTTILANNTLFKDYFRGLVFDIQSNGVDPGNMAMINFKAGKITITYTESINNVDIDKTFVIQLSGHTACFLDQSNTNPKYTDATKPASDSDKANGVSNLYLKGGEGSMSILKLFGEDNFGIDGVTGLKDGVPDKLNIMRANNYLINQAELTFYLNSTAIGDSYVPQRIYLYDFTNNKVLADYGDPSEVTNSKNNKFVFGGIFDKGTDSGETGPYYKFRITEHVRRLVNDSKLINVDLGLVVTEDINLSYIFYSLRDKSASPLFAPMTSVLNPLGTIVFGNNIPSNDPNFDKRLKFEIYYTKAK